MPTDSPNPQSTLAELRQQLQDELQKTLLLEDEDRAYWLENLTSLPQPIIENLLTSLLPKNQLVDSYIQIALSQDKNQEHLKALKSQVRQIKQQAYNIEEKSQTPTQQKSEEDLLKQLDKI